MKAILIEMFGGPECLVIKDIPTPTPKLGQVLVKVKAFGVNHAEMHMRKGEWAESMPVSGIECVGIVAACPGQEFKEGTPVAALMGGLGRTINGTYAEYTCAPVSNVVSLGSTPPLMLPPWHELAAIPESYATAWTCLFRNLELKKDQKLLIRGATSALGQAALNLAASVGAYVTATTRNLGRSQYLKDLGASRVEKEGPGLSQRLREVDGTKFDAILELIGNSTLLDSLTLVRRSGRICLAGFLGGLEPISDFNPLLQMASGVHFSFFGSFVFGTAEFPLSDVPLGDIVRMVVEGKIKAKPSRIFKFEEISEAHRVMEANEATGKMVVCVE